MTLEELQHNLNQALDELHRERQTRLLAEKDLKRERHRFRLLFDQAPVGIVLTGKNAQILQCNRAYEQITGYSEAELIQMTFNEITDPDYRQIQSQLYQELLSGQRDSFELEKPYIHKQGHRVWAQLNSSVARNAEGNILFGLAITTDISKRKQAEQEQERALVIEKDYLKYEREIQIGRQIQADFLPESLPQPRGWEIAARFSPARDVAGDFYDAFELSRGRIGLVIADVCDKGVGAALFMALFRSLLRSLSQQHYSLGLLDVLREDRPQVQAKLPGDRRSRLLPSTGSQALINAIKLTNDYIAKTHSRSNMFATIFFGILDPTSGNMIYINGGHEPLIVLGSEGQLKGRLNPTGPAVGMLPGMNFEMEQLQFAPGDMLLAYTDGVTEAHNSERKLFTEKRLLAVVEDHPPGSAAALLTRIEVAVRDHIGTTDQFDDITMLAVRYLPTSGRESV